MMNGEGFTFGNVDDWRTDPDKCKNGVPFDMGQGRALIVRRANLYDREVQAHFTKVEWDDKRAVQEIFARVLVVDWKGITNAAGEPIPYTPEACVALFQFANELWEDLNRFALNRANYTYARAQEDSEAVKHSRGGETAPGPTAHS
jgi:hypothetical protein